MKLTGALFCVTAFLFAGFSYLETEKRKLKACSGLSDALTVMKNELCAKLLPLKELTERASESSQGCVKLFFEKVLDDFGRIGEEDFSAIWNRTAEESFAFLTPEQLGMLCRPGTVLGKSAGETQTEALEATALYFRAEAERIKEKLPEIRKLAIGLSACMGLLTVIALI